MKDSYEISIFGMENFFGVSLDEMLCSLSLLSSLEESVDDLLFSSVLGFLFLVKLLITGLVRLFSRMLCDLWTGDSVTGESFLSFKLSQDKCKSWTLNSETDRLSALCASRDKEWRKLMAMDVFRNARPYILSLWSRSEIWDSVGEHGLPVSWDCRHFSCKLKKKYVNTFTSILTLCDEIDCWPIVQWNDGTWAWFAVMAFCIPSSRSSSRSFANLYPKYSF